MPLLIKGHFAHGRRGNFGGGEREVRGSPQSHFLNLKKKGGPSLATSKKGGGGGRYGGH